jgi:hypothetical protein
MNDRFELFWSACPRKINKAKAREAFGRALKKTTLDAMLSALEWQRELESWQERDADGVLRYVPHPSSWLNGERWEDERPVKKNTAAIVPLTAGPTCGECVEGWREVESRRVYRCPCRTMKARSA